MPSGAWPGHCPRAQGVGKGPPRALRMHLIWHGRLVCRVVGESVILHPRRPVSLKIGPQIQIHIPVPPPRTPLRTPPCTPPIPPAPYLQGMGAR